MIPKNLTIIFPALRSGRRLIMERLWRRVWAFRTRRRRGGTFFRVRVMVADAVFMGRTECGQDNGCAMDLPADADGCQSYQGSRTIGGWKGGGGCQPPLVLMSEPKQISALLSDVKAGHDWGWLAWIGRRRAARARLETRGPGRCAAPGLASKTGQPRQNPRLRRKFPDSRIAKRRSLTSNARPARHRRAQL